MTVKKAAELLKMDVLTVRLLLQKGQPWGTATRLGDSRHFTYIIYDAEFKRLFGVGGGADAEQ